MSVSERTRPASKQHMSDSNLLSAPILPPDDLARTLTIAVADSDALPHIGLAGNTYTVLLSGQNTAGKYCLIDMHVLPGGGPGPHRHDFEESFIVLEGEIEATFRGTKTRVKKGETLHIPANAPHRFQNISEENARLLCICAPAGQEEFFASVGLPVATRTTPPLKPTPEAMEAFKKKAAELSPKYKTEMLKEAID
jgi:quercetin dioxygenase-like cupin family protein